jgi:hypothetical protein
VISYVGISAVARWEWWMLRVRVVFRGRFLETDYRTDEQRGHGFGRENSISILTRILQTQMRQPTSSF